MKKNIFSFILLFSISSLAQAAIEGADPYIDPAGLADPRNRDEDISNTVVTVDWSMLPDGNYAYTYTIESLIENKGKIQNFGIDMSCDNPSSGALGYQAIRTSSHNGKHILLETNEDVTHPILAAKITAANRVAWFLGISPGESESVQTIVSKEAPVIRQYRIRPTWPTANWGYALYENDPNLPWIDDFIVTGTVLAPRCSTDTSPIPEDPNTPPTDGGDNGTDTPTPTDCKKGKGKAIGHEIGVGHESSNGKHLGHEHNCE